MSDRDALPNVRKIVRITAKPGLAPTLRAALLELEQATHTEPGCRAFQFFQALGDENAFVLFEDFADAQALARHMELPHTKAFFARELVASIKPVALDGQS